MLPYINKHERQIAITGEERDVNNGSSNVELTKIQQTHVFHVRFLNTPVN